MSEPKPILKRPPGYRDPNAPPPNPIPVAATAPNPQPPRKHQIPPTYLPKPTKRKRNFCRCCYCFCCCFLFLLILLLAVAGALFYVWFEPKLPNFHLESFKFSRFNVTVNSEGTFLDAQTVGRFEANNPNNKIAFYYDRTEVRITVEDEVDLGSAYIPAFTQPKRNTTALKFGSEVKHLLIDDAIGKKLKNGIQSKQVSVSVEVRTKVGVGLEGSKLGMMAVRVMCENMMLKNVDNGEAPKCTINILKWINLS